MKNLPDSYYNNGMMTCYLLILPVYSFFFIIGLKPYEVTQIFHISSNAIGSLAFRASIMVAILFIIMLISRMIVKLLKDRLKLNYTQYFIWMFFEVTTTAMFWSLFVWLIAERRDPYFSIVPTMFLMAFSDMISPYIIFSLMSENSSNENKIDELISTIDKLESGQSETINRPIHFIDDKRHLKLMISADSILYIEAADNYVNIHYINERKLIRYTLRNTMKGIEDECLKNRLARCHRSFFINLNRVKVLQRDKEGLHAILEFEGAPRIPISKTCADQVIKGLSALNG